MPAQETIDLGYRPRAWQRHVHTKRQRFTVCALHRRAGKTELAVMELIDKAMQFRQELGLFAYVAPFLKQAKAITWLRLTHYVRKIPAVEVNQAELWVRFPHNGAIIRLFGGDNADAMRGLRLDGIVIDEVAQIKPELWEEVVQPALSDRRGWALFIGTPHGLNLFSKLFFEGMQKPEWLSVRYTVDDTNAIDAGEVMRLRADMSENAFAREYLCDFSASGDDQLLNLADVEDASRRELRADQYSYAPVILGVDVARFGDDSSVIFRRQGLASFTPKAWHGIDNMALAGHVAAQIHEHKPDAVFIDAGHGQGVIDRLRQMQYNVIEVHFGGSPNNPKYKNKRAEMWYETADWIRAGGAIPNIMRLKQDLATPTYSYDASNRIQLESKDAIKARGMPSPDYADALALTFAMPVMKASTRPATTNWDPYKVNASGDVQTDWDPLA
jgi:hypothetical protein